MAADTPDRKEAGAAPRYFDVDADESTVEFLVHRLGVVQLDGRFRRFEGTVRLDPEDLTTTRLHLDVEASSIDTDDAERDERLRGSDLLATSRYPDIAFHSTGVRAVDVNAFALDGELTLHGTTQPVTLNATFLGLGHNLDERRRAHLHARATIDRTDFGIETKDGFRVANVLAADEVEITLDLRAVERDGA